MARTSTAGCTNLQGPQEPVGGSKMNSEGHASEEAMEGIQEGGPVPAASCSMEDVEVWKGEWATLPDVVMEKIFTNLVRTDQVSASLVCQNWSRAFHNPNLWRKIVINLQDATFDSLHMILRFTRRYGHYLHYLEVTYHRTCLLTRRDLERSLTTFFNDIHGRPQLLYFRFRNFLLKRDWRSGVQRGKLLNSVCNFLKTQRTLSEVDMTRLDASLTEGNRLLQTIANGCCATVRTLLLEDFFHSRQAIFRNVIYQRVMENFKHLEVIAMNYSCVCDQVIGCLAENCAGRLRTVSIKCRRNDVQYHQTVSNETWQKLKRACPNVLVDMIVEQINDLRILEQLVPSQVPLRYLNFWTGYLTEEDNALDAINFLNHVLTNFQNTLEDLEIDCDETITMVDTVLEAFLPGLRNLTRLVITASLPVNFVQNVFTLRTQNRIRLNVIRMKLCGTSLEDVDQLRAVIMAFEPQLQDENVYFDISSDWLL